MLLCWVGSALTVGLLVAPTLFSTLPAASAGDIAGRLFRWVNGVSLAAALGLWWLLPAAGRGRRLLGLALALIVLQLLALQPLVAATRPGGGLLFRLAHGGAELAFLAAAGLGLVIYLGRPAGLIRAGAGNR
ncbi:MAG TPA: DUF4149 domain-containing protein [Gammaproteobacteria bacterium]|nr:DUF4149 domain-containing protein [Gammaproteobacteria bacterium]